MRNPIGGICRGGGKLPTTRVVGNGVFSGFSSGAKPRGSWHPGRVRERGSRPGRTPDRFWARPRGPISRKRKVKKSAHIPGKFLWLPTTRVVGIAHNTCCGQLPTTRVVGNAHNTCCGQPQEFTRDVGTFFHFSLPGDRPPGPRPKTIGGAAWARSPLSDAPRVPASTRFCPRRKTGKHPITHNTCCG